MKSIDIGVVLMRNQVHLTDKMVDKISLCRFDEVAHSSNKKDYEEYKKLLLKLVDEVLTPKQRKYITMRFIEGMKVIEIADCNGVCPSTVTRVIQGAIRRLSCYSVYFNKNF